MSSDSWAGPEEEKAVLLGRALAWKPVPEGPRVYEPDIMFLPTDIHEETPLELEKEDDIDEHGSYFMKTLIKSMLT